MTSTPAEGLRDADPSASETEDRAVGAVGAVGEHHLETALALAWLLTSHLRQARVATTGQDGGRRDDTGERARISPTIRGLDRCECLVDGSDGTSP